MITSFHCSLVQGECQLGVDPAGRFSGRFINPTDPAANAGGRCIGKRVNAR
jgi:hypothetical protein